MSTCAVSFIARPSRDEFCRLQNKRHGDLARALAMTPEAFQDFKRLVNSRVHASLDRTRKLEDQDPLVWSNFLHWARAAMPILAEKYEDFWPVELYVRMKLRKMIAQDRHNFRVAMEKHKQQNVLPVMAPRIKASPLADHKDTPQADLPAHEELDSAVDCGSSVSVHPDAVPEEVEDFLKLCDLDLGHLTDAFITSRAGLFNLKRLELIAKWPAALRRDHFERHFSTVLDDVEIEALNMRLSGLNQVYD